jgi:MFS family permease
VADWSDSLHSWCGQEKLKVNDYADKAPRRARRAFRLAERAGDSSDELSHQPRGPRLSWMNRDLFWLFVARALRSLSQGYMTVTIPLYLALLGYGAVELGILSATTAIASALLAAAVGVLSDRFGRKNLIIVISLMAAASGAAFTLSRNFYVILFAGALGTYGGGGGAGRGGAWGPFYPAAQALIAEHSSDVDRTTIFGVLSFVGVLASAAGSLLASAPQFIHRVSRLTLLQGYDVLFLFTALVGVLMAAAVLPVHDAQHSGDPHGADPRIRRARGSWSGLSRRSWRLVARFMVTNATNGLAIGMFAPFIVYWFHRRFGADAVQLATLLFFINLVAAAPFLLAGHLASRLGAVGAVVITRAISSLLLAAMAFMPNFWLAALFYALRTAFNTVSVPVRQSFLMGVIEPAERASAAGISNFPSQAAMAAIPYFSGYLMDNVWFGLPMVGAAVFQGLNTVLYYAFFRDVRPPEELIQNGDGESAD